MNVEQSELDFIKSLRKEYATVASEYGSISLARITLEEELVSLKKQYDELKEKETKFLAELQEKYGVGNLNIETGEFHPTS